MEQLSLIDKGIYVGTIQAAKNEDLLHNLNISLIINCSGENYVLSDSNITVIKHSVKDNGLLSIKDFYEEINDRIDKENGNVLIHCFYGMTRSCTCAIAYIMWKRRCSFDEAYNLIKEKRPQCDIPLDFECYLREYENQLLRGIASEDSNRFESNSVIHVIFEGFSSEDENSILAAVMKYTSIQPLVHLGKYDVTDGEYGVRSLNIAAFIPTVFASEMIEDSLQCYISDKHSVVSISIDELDD